MAKTLLSNNDVLAILGMPESVKTDLMDGASDNYEPQSNKFLNGLVNKITRQQIEVLHFKNPFTIFDKEPIRFGDTIENVRIDITKGIPYDEASNDPFETATPTAKSKYVTLNWEYQWTSTIKQKELAKACLATTGFMQISDAIVEGLATSRNIEEYNAQIAFLNNASLYANGFETIATKSVASDAKAKSKLITKTLATALKDMTLPATDNNHGKFMNVSEKKDLYIIMKQSDLINIDYDYLEGVYNLSKVDITNHIIEVRSFQTIVNKKGDSGITPTVTGEDLSFVILDKNGFDNHVMLDLGTSIYNPKKHYTNLFHTLWKMFNYRDDFNARAFKVDDTK